MSHCAHGFINLSNEGDDLTSEPQTLEVMVLAMVPSTQEATTPLSCFIMLSYQLGIFLLRPLQPQL